MKHLFRRYLVLVTDDPKAEMEDWETRYDDPCIGKAYEIAGAAMNDPKLTDICVVDRVHMKAMFFRFQGQDIKPLAGWINCVETGGNA